VWYDWAIFVVEDQKEIPCQILCFIDITNLKNTDSKVGDYVIDTTGPHAVVRRFHDEPKSIPGSLSHTVQVGKLMDGLFLLPCASISSDVSVVPNLLLIETGELMARGNEFFVVSNQSMWLQSFRKKIQLIGRRSLEGGLFVDGQEHYHNTLQQEAEDDDFMSDDEEL